MRVYSPPVLDSLIEAACEARFFDFAEPSSDIDFAATFDIATPSAFFANVPLLSILCFVAEVA